MKILVTGAKGQLANEIINMLKSLKGEIGSISEEYKNNECVAVDIDTLDITNISNVENFILSCKPDIVINCAAMTNVDACQTNIETAMKVNAIGARNLAIACEKANAKLVHISTDYVFAGDASVAYCEWDRCCPKSIYGKSKFLGEQYVMHHCKKHFIVRTAWPCGYNGNNFVKTIIKLASDKPEIKVVNDQKGNPTNANDLAYHILKIALTDEYGIYHCTGSGECTWYEFASKIVEYYGLDCKVLPCSTEEFPRPAKRPSYSSLDNLMLRCTVGDEMRQWEEALKMFINNLKGDVK